MRARHVDEPVPEDVGAQQHLALAALELAQVEHRAGQPERVAIKSARLLERDEDLAATDSGHHADHQRMLGTTEPHDDVSQLADRFPGAIGDRAAH